ncbi:hypothetical protein CLOM_g14289 [Closterium sp. NIES-68]|nr:hypothetical protein CLOM_g14289 [Closterium sp. NIES-68]
MSHPTSQPSSRPSSQYPLSQLLSQQHHVRAFWRAVVANRADWLLLLALLPLNIALSLYLPPYRRFIPPESLHSPRYPVIDNAGTAANLFMAASLLAPLAVFPLVLLPQRSILELHKSILGLLSAVQTTWLTATLLQCAVGRPRPNFLSACLHGSQPVVSPSAGITCMLPAADLDYYRKSFPSAHAAISFSAAIFLLLFLSQVTRQSIPQRPFSPNYSPRQRLSPHLYQHNQSHQCSSQPPQSLEHAHANARSSPHPVTFESTQRQHQSTAAILWDSLHVSHLWRLPAVAWPLALAAGAGLADLDTYSNAPGDIVAGAALGTLLGVVAHWKVFSDPSSASVSRVSPLLGFERLRENSPPPEPLSADAHLEVSDVPAVVAADEPAVGSKGGSRANLLQLEEGGDGQGSIDREEHHQQGQQQQQQQQQQRALRIQGKHQEEKQKHLGRGENPVPLATTQGPPDAVDFRCMNPIGFLTGQQKVFTLPVPHAGAARGSGGSFVQRQQQERPQEPVYEAPLPDHQLIDVVERARVETT